MFTILASCRPGSAFRFVALLGLVGMTASPASAALLMHEAFDYTVGQNLSNQTHTPTGNQWLRPTAPAGAVHVIAAGDVNYDGLMESPPSNSLSLPRPSVSNQSENRINIPGRPYTRASDASLFFSFTMEMTAFTNFGAVGSDTKNDAAAKNVTHRKGGFIGGFHGGEASTATSMSLGTGFAGTIYTRREIDFDQTGTDGTPGTQTGRYEFGITKQAFPGTATIADANTAFNTNLSFGVGETVLVVGQYQFVDDAAGGNNDIARLWINPTPGDASAEATPAWIAAAGSPNLAGALNLESFHFRSDTNSPGPFRIDNLRIGTSFLDVIPVPEPSTSLLLLAGALLASGLARCQRS